MNRVILSGRLTRDPEVRYSQGEKSTCVSRFSLAVDRRGQEGADFPNIVVFGKTGEFTEKYFHKGMKVIIEGRISTGSYTNKNGDKVYTTEVIADNVEFAESKKTEQSTEQTTQQSNDFVSIPEAVELPF